MTNQDLATAIREIHQLLRQTSDRESIHSALGEHLRLLLQAQAHRATLADDERNSP